MIHESFGISMNLFQKQKLMHIGATDQSVSKKELISTLCNFMSNSVSGATQRNACILMAADHYSNL